MTLYYIARPGGERQGPFPETTVRANLEHPGFYAADTLVWCKGMEGWKPLASVFGTPAPAKPAPAPAAAPAPAPKPKTLAAAPKIYYIAERGGERQGPFSLAELMAARTTPNTLAWKKGMTVWKPITLVRAAARVEAASNAEPPPPVSPATFLRFLYPLFDGRVGIGRFWCAMLVLFGGWFVIPMASELFDAGFSTLNTICLMYLWLVFVPSLIMQLATRLRDGGISGWAAVLLLIPFIGWLGLLLLVFIPGDKGVNKYGPPRPLF